MHHRTIARLLGLGLAATASLSLPAFANNTGQGPTSPVLTQEEIDRLTTLGPVPDDVTPEQLEAAWEAKWGLPDIGVVPDSITKVAAAFPGADGGLTYDPSTLTYTEWVVEGAASSGQLRAAVKDAFDAVASGSNVKLAFDQTTVSLVDGVETIGKLAAAAESDSWPQGVPLTGDWIIEKAKFVLLAGEHSTDPNAYEFFESRWPGLIELAAAVSVPQDESRRADSPSNGWDGGQAMCNRETDWCSSGWGSAFPDRAQCTAGFEWRQSDGTRWMTTAAHCIEGSASNTYWRRYADPRYTFGLNTAADSEVDANSDAGLIRQDAYSYNNWFWVGSRYSTERREITASEAHASLGEAIYFSGSNSGGQQGVVATVGTGVCGGDPVRAVSGLHTMGGDSGATYAVANTATPESGDYRAAGTHSCGADYDVDGWRQFTQVETYIDGFGGGPATN
jgi:hypothetical protein